MKLLNTISKLSLLTRAKDWRFSFVPFVMGCVYLWLVWFDVHFSMDSVVLVGLSLLTTFGFAAFGYFINEYFDREVDKKAGKINKMELLKPAYRLILFLVILAVVFLPWLGLPADRFSYILIALEVSLFILYSLPLLRFKERPWVAGIVDASYAYVVPLWLSFHTYALYSGKLGIPLFLPFFLSAVFLVGYRNIAIHQVDDLFKDMRAGVRTLPHVLGPVYTNHLMRWMMVGELLLFLLAFLFLGFTIPSFWLWVPFFPLLVIYRLLRMEGNLFSSYFCIEAVRHAPDVMYLILLPLFSLLLLSISDPYWTLLLLLHLLVLVPNNLLVWAYVNVVKLTAFGVRYTMGYVVNHTIYYLFRMFGVDLVKEQKSAFGYVKHKWFR